MSNDKKPSLGFSIKKFWLEGRESKFPFAGSEEAFNKLTLEDLEEMNFDVSTATEYECEAYIKKYDLEIDNDDSVDDEEEDSVDF